MSLLYISTLLLTTISSVVAQTFTNCNPLNRTCPANPALGTSHTWYLNETLDSVIWESTGNGDVNYKEDGAEFTIASKLQSPTIQSTFYIFFGIVETHVKMAAGKGIVSSVVIQSDDLDEIDWEWVGSNTSEIQTNFYGKGVEEYTNGKFFHIDDAASEFHNYTTYWDQDKLEWWLDGNLLRTLNYADAHSGTRFPQTPSNVRIGVWPAGDPKNAKGTIEWAGGEVDYDAGPYTMTVKSVRVHDFHTGKEYSYGDKSGTWQSINVADGNSTVLEELNKPPPKSLAQKWAELPTGAKIGVYCGSAAAGVLLIAGFIIFFLRQRKKGRLEHALDDAKWNTERTEMNNFQADWKQSEWKHNGGYQKVN